MKNQIRANGKIFERRSKNLTSGEIHCGRCGEWKRVSKLTDKHFNEEFLCSTCRKELKPEVEVKVKKSKKQTAKKFKAHFPDNCPHKPFFACTRASECVGCYYNPEKAIALMTKDEDDPPKTAKENWFYGDKKHAKASLATLEDIKHGRGLLKGGNRCYFKYARKSDNEE